MWTQSMNTDPPMYNKEPPCNDPCARIELCVCADPAAGKQRKLKAISLQDEGKLKHYYATRVQMICASLKLPHKVQAAALQFLNRFYLSFSVLDHDPKDIFLTAIYLACKVRWGTGEGGGV